MFHDSFAYRTPSFHLGWNKEKTLLYWRINTSIYINCVRFILMIWRIQSYFFVLTNISCYLCCCLVAKSRPTLLWPSGLQPKAPLSKGLPRQEYWNGLPFPSPGDFPDLGSTLWILHHLHWQAGSLPLRHLASPT